MKTGNPDMTIPDALEIFMNQFMDATENARHEYEVYRNETIQTEEVNSKVNFFKEQLEATYDDIKDSDGYLYLKQLIEWIDSTDIILNENEIQKSFCLSKMPVLDETNEYGKSKLPSIRLS